MSQQTARDVPLPFQLSRLIASLWVPRALYVAAELGVADALGDEPRASGHVAIAVNAEAGAVRRLLRALTALDVCSMTDDGRFALTPLGECLRADSPESVRAWALLMGGPMVWRAWGSLLECVRTGDPAAKLLDGRDTFEQIAPHPEEQAVFDQSIADGTRHLAPAVATAYDFAGIETLVDLGGGYGALLPPILSAYPKMRGIVADLAHCRPGAERLMRDVGLDGRCEFVACDMFSEVPPGADAYVLKSVIHDWNDERSVAILRQCRAAMGKDARLLLVEIVVPERLGSSSLDRAIVGTDLNMLVNTGGMERTEAEYRALLEAAGFRLTRTVPTDTALRVIEAVRNTK
jgi:hypothetical protein